MAQERGSYNRMQMRPNIGSSITWFHRNREYMGIVIRPPTKRMGAGDITASEIHDLALKHLIPKQFLKFPHDTVYKVRTNTKLMYVAAFSRRRYGYGYEYCGIKAVHVDYFMYRDVDITEKWISKYIKAGYLIKRPPSTKEGMLNDNSNGA